MMIGEILVKTLTCLLISPLFLDCWRGMINLIYINIYISKLNHISFKYNMYSVIILE